MNACIEALRKIANHKPKRRPEWHEDTGHNFDDAESNGYDIAAWDLAEIAEAALKAVHKDND